MARILIDAPRQLDALPQGRETLRSAVRKRLQADSTVRLESDSRDATHLLHVRVGVTVGDDGQVDAHTSPVQVQLRPLHDGATYDAFARGKGDDVLAGAVAGFEDAWQVVGRERRLDTADDQALVKALTDTDRRIRDFAIVRLGERRATAAVKPLCDLLEKEEQPELVLRAIGSLVAIGDPRAVEPLIELSRRKDPEFVLQIIFAVGAIGGRTAEGYLVTMASGHPVEAVRKGAEQALKEMQRSEHSGQQGREATP